MNEYEKLDQFLNAPRADELVKSSTSDFRAVGLAAERPELLPAPYDGPGEGCRRMDALQGAWVRRTDPQAEAEHAKLALNRAGEGALVHAAPDSCVRCSRRGYGKAHNVRPYQHGKIAWVLGARLA